MTNGEFIRRELINIINNADYKLLNRILGNSDAIEEIDEFATKMYKKLDVYIKDHNGFRDIENDELFNRLVDEWYLEEYVKSDK